MNRAPAPRDTWWNDHQRKCGGTFTKIKEPEKPTKKSKSESTSKNEKGSKVLKTKNVDGKDSITNWFPKKNETTTKEANKINKQSSASKTSRNVGSSTITTSSKKDHVISNNNEVFQSSSDNSSSNIYGFKMSANEKSSVPAASFSGAGQTIGKLNNNGQNREGFLQRLEKNMRSKETSNDKINVNRTGRNSVTESQHNINTGLPNRFNHANQRLLNESKTKNLSKNVDSTLYTGGSGVIHISDEEDIDAGGVLIDCPACPAKVAEHELNAHLDICLK